MCRLFKLKFFLISIILLITTIGISSLVNLAKPAHAQDAITVDTFLVYGSHWGITAGPDGNLWFTESDWNRIGRVSTDGNSVSKYTIPTANSVPQKIITGPDGNLWFTEGLGNKIGRITPDGVTITEYSLPVSNSKPIDITVGPDGSLWFTERAGNKIGKITLGGAITEYSVPTQGSYLWSIAKGPDGNVWFTEFLGKKIGRITPDGIITEYPVSNNAYGITTGPDGNIWFTAGNKIARMNPNGDITEFSFNLPANSMDYADEITSGPDGNLWFFITDGFYQYNEIGRITLSGNIDLYPMFNKFNNDFYLQGITSGPDGNMWFADANAGIVGRVNLNNPTPTPSPSPTPTPTPTPISTLETRAVDLARSVIGAPYLGNGFTFGGKGYDWNSKLFVESPVIKTGYNFYNSALKQRGFGAGLDCSGLIMWSYNKAFGANEYLNRNSIYYEGADGQYRNNSQPISENQLRQGDLLFFDWDGNGNQDHVAMYIGGDDVANAKSINSGIVLSKKSELKNLTGFSGFRRRIDPVVKMQIKAKSPIYLSVTDPDGNNIDQTTYTVTADEYLREIPGILYYSQTDIDGNGFEEDTVYSPQIKKGEYIIKATPKPGASPNDTFGLVFEGNASTIIIADNVKISDIPQQGYGVKYSEEGISLFNPGDIGNKITSLTPAKVWVGLKNSDDVGVKFDLLAEVYKDGTLISSGQINSVAGGSSGFNNAKLNTIQFSAFPPVDFPSGSSLKLKLSVRNTCTGPSHNSGIARLWFNDTKANSQFGLTIGNNTNIYFLRDVFSLSSAIGLGPVKTIDVQAGAKCSPFKSFGTWTLAPQSSS